MSEKTPETEERARSSEDTEASERADTRPELTVLVLLRDQLQKIRIAEGNRSSSAKALGEEDRAELHLGYEKRLQELEDDITESVRVQVREHPAWPWLKDIRGVAETSAGLVLGYIDISRAEHVSSLWRYAGFGVVDGKRERPVKGVKLAYNARLKTMCWRLIDLQIKARGPYRKAYDDAKHTYITTRMEPEAARKVLAKMAATNNEEPIQDERAVVHEDTESHERAVVHKDTVEGERAEDYETPVRDERAMEGESPEDKERTYWTLGHVEAAARRKAAKLFLSHLYVVWREAEGLPTRSPWIEEHGEGHTMLDPWQYVRQETAA